MRRRWLALVMAGTAAAALTLALGTMQAQEQEQEAKTATLEAAARKQEPERSIYRLDYVVRETEHGKTSNTRKYTLTAEEHRNSSFRVGSRIPLMSGKDLQYHDIGVNLDCSLDRDQDSLKLGTTIEINSVANGEMTNSGAWPVVRTFKLSDRTGIVPGKLAQVGAIDDVTSERRYEIEVTATKIK